MQQQEAQSPSPRLMLPAQPASPSSDDEQFRFPLPPKHPMEIRTYIDSDLLVSYGNASYGNAESETHQVRENQKTENDEELYEGHADDMAKERREYEQQEEADNYAKRFVHRCDQDQDYLDLFPNEGRNHSQREQVSRSVQGPRQRQTNVTIMETAVAVERDSRKRERLDAESWQQNEEEYYDDHSYDAPDNFEYDCEREQAYRDHHLNRNGTHDESFIFQDEGDQGPASDPTPHGTNPWPNTWPPPEPESSGEDSDQDFW